MLKKVKGALPALFWNRSFPSPKHCLSAAPSFSDATLLSILEGVPLSATWDAGDRRSAPRYTIQVYLHNGRAPSTNTLNIETVLCWQPIRANRTTTSYAIEHNKKSREKRCKHLI